MKKILLLMLLLPSVNEAVSAQSFPEQLSVQLGAVVSGFFIDAELPFDSRWGEAVGLRAKAVVWDHLLIDVAYSRSQAREGAACALNASGCHDELQSPSNVLTVGFGAQVPLGKWRPGIGVMRGRFWNADLNQSVVGWFAGTEFDFHPPLGLSLEFRHGRVRWPEGKVGWNMEVSVGLSMRF